jgi:iron complex transport system substrate-binding protein
MVEAAGAEALGPRGGERFVDVTWDDVAALRPDALVVAPCGFDLQRTEEAARPWSDRLHALAPRVLLLDGNAYVNRPGPRVVDAVEKIAAWLG